MKNYTKPVSLKKLLAKKSEAEPLKKIISNSDCHVAVYEADKRIGKIEYANGGTLFLDEIGDIPLLCQPKILRVIESQQLERLGGIGAHCRGGHAEERVCFRKK